MALPNGIASTEEFLDAQSHVWNHSLSFINSTCIKCAVQLGIPDLIHKHAKPMTLAELTDALPIDKAKSVYIERLMGMLVHSKFFTKVKVTYDDDDKKEDREEGYCLTPASRLLLRDMPSNVAPLLFYLTHPIIMEPWHHMSQWFRSEVNPTPFATAHGKTLWELLGQDRMLGPLFNEAMANDTLGIASMIVRDCRHAFEGLKSIVDVAGGTGTMAKAMVDAFPGLECVVLDRPHVVAGLEGGGRLSFVGGDMFESIPNADAVFMKWILHNWSDDDCVKVLKKCKEAIPSKEKGGKVIIVDIVVGAGGGRNKLEPEEPTGLETQLFSDMLMMVLMDGKERNEKEWAKIFYEAGFSSYKMDPMLGLRSIIQVFP